MRKYYWKSWRGADTWMLQEVEKESLDEENKSEILWDKLIALMKDSCEAAGW